jgi:hypothetical protein
MSQPQTVFALYRSRDAAESAADKLIRSGVASSDISVLLPEQVPTLTQDSKMEPKPGNEAASASSRGIFSGTLGVLAGLSMLALPGLGPLVGEGTLKAGLAGLGVGGTVGDFAKYLIQLGVPALEAKRYEDRLKQGAVLFSVRCDSSERASRLSDLMRETGGEDLCLVAESSGSADTAKAAREPAPATPPKETYAFIDRTMHKATPEEFENKPEA